MTVVIFAFLAFVAAAFGTEISGTIDPAVPGRLIPKSFAGLSREWRRFPSPDDGPASAVHPSYLRLIEHLAALNDGALSLRVGGNSSDGMGAVPEDDRWLQFGEIFNATRTPLIININLARKNAELDKELVRTARRLMPPGSIEIFELGNEPDGWPNRYKPADYTFETYLADFNEVARQLVPALTTGLAGPAWAHGAPPDIIGRFVEAQKPMVTLLTVHSYRFDPKKNPTPKQLLEEGATAGFARSLGSGIVAAHDAGLKLRLGECGSAWGGGVRGFSDTFAAALWTIDFMFELANAGLDGVNFHGGGTSAYSAISEDVDKATGKNVITAQPSYYGMLVFAEAVAHQAQLVPVAESSGGNSHVKLWATQDAGGVVRVVAINKNFTDTAEVKLKVNGREGDATLNRLEAPALDATRGITFAGQTFDNSPDGNPQGPLGTEHVGAKNGEIRFSLAPASAALLTVGR